MAPIPRTIPDPKFEELKNHPKLMHSHPDCWFELPYNNRTLKYTLEILGNVDTSAKQKDTGFPLYIGLHGGGTEKTNIPNDELWDGCVREFYRQTISQTSSELVVFLCPRGLANNPIPPGGNYDEWNLHFQPDNFVLLEAVITNLIRNDPPEFKVSPALRDSTRLSGSRKHFVDPNRVFLWGFSAGGDGAFRMATKMTDRFAAVAIGAGHPGKDARFANTANVQLLIECNEDDWQRSSEFQRTEANLVWAEKKLRTLHDALDQSDQSKYYQYRCFIVKNTQRNATDSGGKPLALADLWMRAHNYWSAPDEIVKAQRILNPTPQQFDDWLAKWSQAGGNSIGNHFFTLDDDSAYISQDLNPVSLFKDLVRDPSPELVVWDLAWRPEPPGKVKDVPKDEDTELEILSEVIFSYWLYLRSPPSKALNATIKASDYVPESARFTVSENGNTLDIHKPTTYMGYLLKKEWLTRPISVYVGTGEARLQVRVLTVSTNSTIEKQSKEARGGDPNFEFAALLYLAQDDQGGWKVQVGESL